MKNVAITADNMITNWPK